MASDASANLARGLVFGGALAAAEVWSPKVIVDQMNLSDFHMLKVFLSANVVSGLLFPLFTNTKSINTKPRAASDLGRFGPYDGNVIGGAMLGAGMALTGACPGTIFVQIASGVPSAVPVLLGALLGGITYAKVSSSLQTEEAKRAAPQDESKLTVQGRFGLDPHLTLFAVEAALIGVITLTSKLQPASLDPKVLDPVVSGVLIGIAQLASLLIARMPLGISGACEEFGKWIWYLLDRVQGSSSQSENKEKSKPAPAYKHIIFAIGITVGALLLRKFRPEFAKHDNMTLPLWRSLVGGFALSFGSRLGGGCTSGHGLSGAALLSVSSFISVAAMFGGGIGFSKLFL